MGRKNGLTDTHARIPGCIHTYVCTHSSIDIKCAGVVFVLCTHRHLWCIQHAAHPPRRPLPTWYSGTAVLIVLVTHPPVWYTPSTNINRLHERYHASWDYFFGADFLPGGHKYTQRKQWDSGGVVDCFPSRRAARHSQSPRCRENQLGSAVL